MTVTMTLCRVIAWLIVIAGIIDPVIALTLPTRPRVALVSDPRLPDPGLVDRVERALSGSFTVARHSQRGAAAVVSIGYKMPPAESRGINQAFAVFPEPRSPFVAISSVSAADRPLLRSRLPVRVTVRSAAARGKTLVVTLRKDGAAIDRASTDITSNDATARIELQFTPSTTGEVALSVEARIGDSPPATANLSRTVRDERWAILFFDRRPAWMSTFVRRAIESDPRFIVTSRVATSNRGPSIIAGQPPASLSVLPSLDVFDTVVVGAPEELTDADANGLSKFMRERNGAVVLLLDEHEPAKHSPALQRLTGVTQWKLTERAEPFGSPKASAVLSPASLQPWAEQLAPQADAQAAPVWRTQVGRASLVVSGVLDAWRFRDSDRAAFSTYWRSLVAEAAQGPSTEASRQREASGVEPDERALIRAWTDSTGGATFAESSLASLPVAMTAALKPESERRPTRPMQSAWWMAPLGLVLGLEWWFRRSAGAR